jgi:hypothetical protein
VNLEFTSAAAPFAHQNSVFLFVAIFSFRLHQDCACTENVWGSKVIQEHSKEKSYSKKLFKLLTCQST